MTALDLLPRIDAPESLPEHPHALPYEGKVIKSGLTEYYTDSRNFAVHAGHDVRAVDICFLDDPTSEAAKWSLEAHQTDDGTLFTGYIPKVKVGSLYYLDVHFGCGDDARTLALLDPYAKAFHQETPTSQMHGVVVEAPKDHVRIRPEERVIYEAHLKGATMLHPDVPKKLRGTYLGFSHPAHIRHMKDELGVTTVELLPVMQSASEPHLRDLDKTNYWGYNPVSFFAPHAAYASSPERGAAVDEFKQMVRELHEAGLEVVLDVVYNHTADGGEGQQPYSLRGLDEEMFHTYYDEEGRKRFHNYSGTGITAKTPNPKMLQTTLDSLHYWVEEMGVDGFRFDLAASLIRNNAGHIDNNSPFLAAIDKDPILSDRLLIAEPWDCGECSDGKFVARGGWLEWSRDFRDITRDFWGIGPKDLGAIAYALCGPFGDGSLNFITAHDGFTMKDLVSYSYKHNEANGENNRDGTNDNKSWNHGVEGDGPFVDEFVSEARLKTMRNLFLTLLLSHGTPMILAGDEFLRTQKGNNNAYCQDNEITWHNWDHTREQREMIEFVGNAIRLRKAAKLFDPKTPSRALDQSPIGEPPIAWLNVWGETMSDADIAFGEPIFGRYTSGQLGNEVGDSLLYYVNGSSRTHYVTLPRLTGLAGDYEVVADTTTGEIELDGIRRSPQIFAVQALSSVVLRRVSSRRPLTDYDCEKNPVPELSIPDARQVVGPLIS